MLNIILKSAAKGLLAATILSLGLLIALFSAYYIVGKNSFWVEQFFIRIATVVQVWGFIGFTYNFINNALNEKDTTINDAD